jgi:hypothetical protein
VKLEWGNLPQWISAVCALALSLLALYGLFFSTTSQTLVAYLQSELVARNQHISASEVRERELQLSVETAKSASSRWTGKRACLKTKSRL